MQNRKVYPLGYSAHTKQIEELMQDEHVLLVDIRKSPYTNYAAWQKASLEEKYGKHYRWLGETLGNKNYKGGPIELIDAKIGIRRLIALLERGYNVVLLCGCKDYDTCHTKVVIGLLLQAYPNIDIVYPDEIALPNTVKCFSIKQPWLWYILNADILAQCGVEPKYIENRNWTTSYRGPILLHAGKTVDDEMFIGEDIDDYYLKRTFGGPGADLSWEVPRTIDEYERGAIIGKANFVDVVEHSNNPWFVGKYGFVLKDIQAIEPIPYRGQLGLFDVPLSILKKEVKEEQITIVEQKCISCDEKAEYHSPSGTGYCTEHYMCSQGHTPKWIQWRGHWVCECAIKDVESEVKEPKKQKSKKKEQLTMFDLREKTRV